MPSPAELVAALSRAYALTDVFPAGDPVSTEALEHLRRLLRDGATVTVGGAGLRVDGIDVPDFHGRSGRFARDLRMLGVRELKFEADHHVGDLERFVRMLRDDAVRGESDGLRAHRGPLLGGVIVLFEADVAPDPATPPPPTFPPPPSPSVISAPRERDGEARPGAALVESIMELFEGDPFDPLPPGGRPAPQSGPPSLPDPSPTSTSASSIDPSFVDPSAREAEAMSAPDLDLGPVAHLEAGPAADLDVDPSVGDPSPLLPEPEVPSPSPHRVFGFWQEDPEEGSEPVLDEEPLGFAEPDPALVDSIRGLFDGDPRGARGELPDPEGGDPHMDRSPGEPPRADTGRSTPEDPIGHAVAPGALEGRGVVGDASFGRRVHPELVDSPDSVREASFGSLESLGGANIGGAGTSDPAWPLAGFRRSGGEGPQGGSHLRSGNPPPAAGGGGEDAGAPPGEGDLGLFGFPVQG